MSKIIFEDMTAQERNEPELGSVMDTLFRDSNRWVVAEATDLLTAFGIPLTDGEFRNTLCERIVMLAKRSYNEGAEKMRERAAKEARKNGDVESAESIKELPLPKKRW